MKNKMTDITHAGKVDMSDVSVGSMFAADIQGPYRIQSLTNNSYIFGLIDYKSRRLWQYFIDSKDKAFDCLNDFFTFEVNRLRKKYSDLGVISLIADGGELHSLKTRRLCALYDVSQGFTCTNTPENNAIIERVWRTVDEMACCMLEDSKKPEPYWEEARKHSGYIYNRIPPTRKPEIGPWENPQAAYYRGCRDAKSSISLFHLVLMCWPLYLRTNEKESIMVIKLKNVCFVDLKKNTYMDFAYTNLILMNG